MAAAGRVMVTRPDAGDRVRHTSTGDVGTLNHYARISGWAMVRWDVCGPGMVGDDGLSYVASGLLVRHSIPPAGGRS